MKWISVVLTYFTFIMQAVKSIEDTLNVPGAGANKKQLILDVLQAGGKVGENVPNSTIAMISLLIDTVVTSLNTTGFFKKSSPVTPTPVS